MALTKSQIAKTVFGNKRLEVWDVTPDAAATAFSGGLSVIDFAQVTIKSGVTDATMGVFTENQDVAGTTANGTLAMTSVVSSGEIKYRVFLYGR